VASTVAAKRLEKEFWDQLQPKKKNREKHLTSLVASRLFVVENEIDWLEASRILEQAERLGIPTPPTSPEQMRAEVEARIEGRAPFSHLTGEDRLRLREEIRKERRARVEDRMLWVNHLGPLVSPLTGLLGVVLALLSFMHSCK
jgi:hypothetical protein